MLVRVRNVPHSLRHLNTWCYLCQEVHVGPVAFLEEDYLLGTSCESKRHCVHVVCSLWVMPGVADVSSQFPVPAAMPAAHSLAVLTIVDSDFPEPETKTH